MSESGESGTEPGPAEAASPQAGILGNLPRSRPSVRSPRRAQAPPPSTAEAPSAPAGTGEPRDAGSPADLEALARTGIAVAGGAAALGLRIAGRAASAVRGAVERR